MSWTVQDFIDFCKRKNIPLESYSLYSDKDEAFCLERKGDEWRIYYSERGSKNDLAWAKSEAQALNVLKLFLLEAHGHSLQTDAKPPERDGLIVQG